MDFIFRPDRINRRSQLSNVGRPKSKSITDYESPPSVDLGKPYPLSDRVIVLGGRGRRAVYTKITEHKASGCTSLSRRYLYMPHLLIIALKVSPLFE
uniref:Uncharacterized protein n=1 Tax=Salmonella enterica subsp. enterica serovar Heidelberg TaxID=611 RepID=H9TIL3_SALET|nr:hypothetical protein pSH163_135_36 [Salmonella enterica subsp. enterica serovar Heidelberg]